MMDNIAWEGSTLDATINLNEKAKLIADAFWTVSNGQVFDNIHVYLDGDVIQVVGTTDQHLEARQILIEEGITFGEARVGQLSIFLLPDERDVTVDMASRTSLMSAWGRPVADHRQEDVCRLEVFEWAEYLLGVTRGEAR